MAHYPKGITGPVQEILSRPGGHREVAEKHKPVRLYSIGDTYNFSPKKFIPGSITWLNAHVGPCVFLAAIQKDEEGFNERIAVRHCPSPVDRHYIDMVFHRLKPPASVFAIGGSLLTSRSDLEKTVSNLVTAANDQGITLKLNWQAADHPLLIDGGSNLPISDLGLDLDPSMEQFRLSRFVSLVVTEQ